MPRGSPDWQPWTAVQRFADTGGATPFEQKATVAKAIVEGSATSTDIVMVKGFVSHVQIRFPTGPAGLLHIQIWDQSGQLWPGTVGQWFSGDNELIEFDTEFDVELVVADYKLVIKGYNEDDAYPHSVLVRMWVVELPA